MGCESTTPVMVCLLMEQPPSLLLLPVLFQRCQYRPYIYSAPLCSAVRRSTQQVPSLGACRLYAWKFCTLGLLESYPAGVSKSKSPVTAALTIVLGVATSRFVKALKNKSWVLNVSAIVLQFAVLLGEYITEER